MLKLKKVKVGDVEYAVVGPNGKPVYIDDADDNKELELDGGDLHFQLQRVGKESKDRREKLEALQNTTKQFEGIDPDKAREALKIAGNIEAGKLVELGKVDEMKAAATKAVTDQMEQQKRAYDEQIKNLTGERDTIKGQFDNEVIGGGFARSKFIGEKVAIPRRSIEAMYRGNFKIENGKAVAYDSNGNPIYGKTDPSNPAPFDEAIEKLIAMDPDRDNILKGNQSGGSGAGHGHGSGNSGKRTITRTEYNAMDQRERNAMMGDPAKRPQIVDG